MTRKDFELIAGVLNGMHRDTDFQTIYIREIICRFTNALREDNPQFNQNKFMSACIPTEK